MLHERRAPGHFEPFWEAIRQATNHDGHHLTDPFSSSVVRPFRYMGNSTTERLLNDARQGKESRSQPNLQFEVASITSEMGQR